MAEKKTNLDDIARMVATHGKQIRDLATTVSAHRFCYDIPEVPQVPVLFATAFGSTRANARYRGNARHCRTDVAHLDEGEQAGE